MFIFLFFLGLITSFIGTNTGGSSLITIPAMIAYGLPPQVAIACARVTSIGTLIAGIKAFHAKNKVDYKAAFPAAVMSLIGSSIGAIIMTHFSATHLNRAIGILTLCLLSIPFIFRDKKVISKTIPRYKKWTGYSLFTPFSTFRIHQQIKLKRWVTKLLVNKNANGMRQHFSCNAIG